MKFRRLMNKEFLDLLEAARQLVLNASTNPKLSAGDMCVDAKKVKALEEAAAKAERVAPPTAPPTE